MAHTVKAFDTELDLLTGEVKALGDDAIGQLERALAAMLGQDAAAAAEVIARDDELDARTVLIEQMAARLIALRQPMADDLRRPLVAIKVALNLERCGDLAKNIAKRGRVLPAGALDLGVASAIEDLGRLVTVRLAAALGAYEANDVAAAIEVWAQDAEVDERHEQIARDILGAMRAGPDRVEAGMHLLFMVKNLERIGDHATNVAELVHFEITGSDIAGRRPKVDPLTTDG